MTAITKIQIFSETVFLVITSYGKACNAYREGRNANVRKTLLGTVYMHFFNIWMLFVELNLRRMQRRFISTTILASVTVNLTLPGLLSTKPVICLGTGILTVNWWDCKDRQDAMVINDASSSLDPPNLLDLLDLLDLLLDLNRTEGRG